MFRSLPIYSQHLLVLLIGTFRVIHSNSERAKTGMTAEALGVSVAPSFFHTCVSEGKIAKPDEVQKFKVSNAIFYIIDIENSHAFLCTLQCKMVKGLHIEFLLLGISRWLFSTIIGKLMIENSPP